MTGKIFDIFSLLALPPARDDDVASHMCNNALLHFASLDKFFEDMVLTTDFPQVNTPDTYVHAMQDIAYKSNLLARINKVFGPNAPHHQLAIDAFEMKPQALQEALVVLVDQIFPSYKISEKDFVQKGLDVTGLDTITQTGQLLQQELKRIYPEARDTLYIMRLGPVFNFPINAPDRNMYQLHYRSLLDTASRRVFGGPDHDFD